MQATIRKSLAVVALGLAGVAAASTAHAGGVHWSIGINLPPIGTVVSNAPVYYPPPAVVYAPAPVVYGPPPVVYGPPAYYRPAPVVYQHGWHGKKHHHRHHHHHRHGRDRDDDDRRAWRHDHRYRH